MKYSAYPSYKDSGVEWFGEIPSHWMAVGFKRYFESVVDYRGKTPEKVEHGIFLVTARNIKKGVINYQASSEYVKAEDYNDIMSRGVPKVGDILFTTEAPLGEVANIDNTNIALAQRVIKFCAEKNIQDNYYLKYLMMSAHFQNSLMLFSSGSTALGIKAERLVYLRKLLPPLQEQQTITNYLDKATAKIDTLIAKQTRLIALLKEKRQAVISTAVTRGLDSTVAMKDSGVEWLGEIPEHWDISTLKFQLTNIDFRRIPISASERGDIQGVYPYYGASGIIDFVEDYIFDEMTILIGEDGANLLSKSTPLAFIADGKYWVNNHAHILKPKDSLFNYWTYVLNNLDLTPFISGSAQPKLTAEALGNLVTVFPESITDRILIANYLDDKTKKIDNLISKSTQAIDLLKEKRTALISSAVTGKIDVRETL